MKTTTVGDLFAKATYTGNREDGTSDLLYFFDENKKEIGYCFQSDRNRHPETACEITRHWSEEQMECMTLTKIK